jgi:hypothetical protein
MNPSSSHSRRGRHYATAAGVALLLTAALVLGSALHGQGQAPQPTAATAPTSPAPSSTAGVSTDTAAPGPHATTTRGPVLRAATPVRLSIPAIRVDSDLLRLGLNRDRSVQVPPLGRDSRAGWYRYSPTPGQLGPSIILGHVDSKAYGPGVFFKLGALHPRDTIAVTREDHTVAVFAVDRVLEYHKNDFPSLAVYGNTDHAALRLITCGGKFDFSAHSYEDNIVAYASLVSSHRA